jgi:hypothetical protein
MGLGFSGERCGPWASCCELFHLPDLETDFSVNLTGRTNFDCGCSVYVIWTQDIDCIVLILAFGAHGGCDQSTGDAYSSKASDPTCDIYAHSDLYFLHDL